MTAYTQPIGVALLVFLGIAFATFIPWLVYTYRKYGFLSFSKTMIAFSFIFYFLAALFLVLLPLPETTNTCALQSPNTVHYNWMPFQFMRDIFTSSGIVFQQPATWLYAIKQPAFYQAFFNFLLLMPFGVYLRYFLKDRSAWKKAFLFGLALTLFYEVTQVTGIYGIYNCPYRIFDVDDLLLNSTGSLVGFLLAPVLLSMFPTHAQVVEQGERFRSANIVRPIHRIAAIAIDLIVIELIVSIISAFVGTNAIVVFFVTTIVYFLVLWCIPIATNGATVGMWLLKIRVVRTSDEQFSKRAMLKFAIAIYAVYAAFVLLQLLNAVTLNIDSPFYVFQIAITIASFIGVFLLMAAIVVHVLLTILRKQKGVLFFEAISLMKATRK